MVSLFDSLSTWQCTSRTIKKYWHPDASHIKTSLDAKEPRLLLVSTDVQNSTSVTFDSYEKSDDEYGKAECRTVYGEEKTKYVIEYSEGIGMEHLDTSMAFHQRLRYPTLMVKKHNSGGRREERPFWDGIYLRNTPLREVIQAHRDYWFKVRGLKQDIPKLKVYIVDLYPIEEKGAHQKVLMKSRIGNTMSCFLIRQGTTKR